MNGQPENDRTETAVRLADLLDYLRRHKLRVVRFEWGGEGLPVVYCECRQDEAA